MIIMMCHLAPLEPLTCSATLRPPSKFRDISKKTSRLIIYEWINSWPNTMEFLKRLQNTPAWDPVRALTVLFLSMWTVSRVRPKVTPGAEDLCLSRLVQTQLTYLLTYLLHGAESFLRI